VRERKKVASNTVTENADILSAFLP